MKECLETFAIEVRGLVKRFEDVAAVAGTDFEVSLGQCMGLRGPNGAGKTTTVEILKGLQRPTSGEVRLLGHSWSSNWWPMQGLKRPGPRRSSGSGTSTPDTGQPFLMEDGLPNEAVMAEGPLYAAVDQYALLFIPTRGPVEPAWPVNAEQQQFLEEMSENNDVDENGSLVW